MRAVYDGVPEIAAMIEERGATQADEVAILAADRNVTYGELADGAARVGTGLHELGVQPGDRVATMLEPAVHTLDSWFGVAWAAGVEVPINTDFRGEFLRHVLAQSGSSVLVVRDRWVERLAGLDLPQLRHLLVVGDTDGLPDVGIPVTPFAAVRASDPGPRVERAPTDLAYILYTSGTTGPSKGAMQSSLTAIQAGVRTGIALMDITPDDTAYSVFPLFHITGRNVILTTALYTGGRCVLRESFSPATFWDEARATGATWFVYMGAVMHLLSIQEPRPDDADNPIRRMFGAAPVEHLIPEFERRFDLQIIQGYGSTEVGIATATEPGNRKAGTNGTAMPHVEVEVHDPDDNPCPPGIDGEIVVRPKVPAGIFSGYWGLPEYSLEAFRNQWFHTGDRGYLTDEGDLVFMDRIKDSLRRRGENISSFEVEAAVCAHPLVVESAAYAVPSPLTEDDVMVAVTVADRDAFDVLELFDFCIRTMPRFTVPRYLRVLDELPKTPSQRVQKYKLREEGVTADTVDREALGIVVPKD